MGIDGEETRNLMEVHSHPMGQGSAQLGGCRHVQYLTPRYAKGHVYPVNRQVVADVLPILLDN